MGDIGRELIRRSRERIIAMQRELDAIPRNRGWDHRIEELQRDIARERSALDEKIRLEGPDL